MLKMPGVHFFISCITGTVSQQADQTDGAPANIKPGVSYFVVFSESVQTNETSLFSTLHDSGVEAMVTPIRTRGKKPTGKEKMLTWLKNVLKVTFCLTLSD